MSADDKALVPVLRTWLDGGDGYDISVADGRINAVPKYMASLSSLLMRQLNVISHGVHIGDIKGRIAIPSQALALSQSLAAGAFPQVDLSREDAVRYLRREAMALPDGAPRGFVLLMYDSVPLGFVKNLGSRANNLYPPEWRILTQRDA